MDVRIRNTKERIQQGLLKLLQTASINELTTSEIMEAAEVSRKTFYAHYRDKQALLNEIGDTIVAAIQAALQQDRRALSELDHVPTRNEIYTLAQESFSATVQTVEHYREPLRILLSQHGDLRLYRRIHQVASQEFLARAPYLFNLTTPPITRPKVPVKIPMDYTVESYVGSLITLLVHWLRDPHPVTATKMKAALGCVQVMSPLQLVYLADSPTALPQPASN